MRRSQVVSLMDFGFCEVVELLNVGKVELWILWSCRIFELRLLMAIHSIRDSTVSGRPSALYKV